LIIMQRGEQMTESYLCHLNRIVTNKYYRNIQNTIPKTTRTQNDRKYYMV